MSLHHTALLALMLEVMILAAEQGTLPIPNTAQTMLWTVEIALLSVIVFKSNARHRVIKRLAQQAHELLHEASPIRLKADTDLVRLAQTMNEIQEAQRLTEEKYRLMEQSRRRFMANISHDIRTPLASIQGYLEAIADGVATDETERQQYLRIASTKAASLKQLIDDIFLAAKLHAGHIMPAYQSFDLAELLRECLIDIIPELHDKEIALKADIPDTAAMILADPLSIARVLRNLLRNALDHGAEGKVVGVSLRREGFYWRIEVWDQGPGIACEDLPHIFDELYTADAARTKTSSGLGLAIVRALVDQHQGKVSVSSTPYEKTVFAVLLPQSPQALRS